MMSILNRLKKGNNFRSNKRITSEIHETPEFKKRLAFLVRSEKWPKEKLDAYQLKELKRVISFAYTHIPYYRDLFKKLHLTPQSITHLSDLQKFPTLTRETIQQNYDRLLPEGVNPKKLLYRTTGGSTGNPLVIFSDTDFVSRDRANTLYYLKVAGYDPYHYKSVRLYGDRIPEKLIRKNVFWYEAKDGKQLVLSCYHLTKETVGTYVAKLNAFSPAYIHARPSAIYTLARQMKDQQLVPHIKIGAIFCDGEILYNTQRMLIEKVFAARVYNVYGHTEGAAVGISCPHSRLLHFLPQVGVLELLDRNGKPVTRDGSRGEMVVTGFNNNIFPLIRYKTQDMGIATNKHCSCGRAYRMLSKVEGRVQDYVVNKEGSLVPLAPAIFNYNDMDWTGVDQFKIVQKIPGKLIFRVVLNKASAPGRQNIKQRLVDKFSKIFGPSFSIEVMCTDAIAYTAVGKHRYLDQKLKVN